MFFLSFLSLVNFQVLRPTTKLVSITTPGNPTGVRIPLETIEALVQLMESVCPDAYLLVDETYRDALYGKQQAPLSPATLSPKVITVNSLSKAMGAPGNFLFLFFFFSCVLFIV